MKNKYIISWVLRGLGILCVLGYFFGGEPMGRLFPGLIGKSLGPVFYAGILLYVIGAILYRILYTKEKKEREESLFEEKRKAQKAAIEQVTSNKTKEDANDPDR